MANVNQNTQGKLKDLSSLSEYLTNGSLEQHARSIPPLEQWHPENHGEMDIVIKANGEWWHEGDRITRQSLIDLFATVLWMEEDDKATKYYLKTPVEKLRIKVEDVPFFINDVNIVDEDDKGAFIEFKTNTGDVIRLDDKHPLQMLNYNGEDRPYIPVRFGMLGLISRSVFGHLIKIGELSEDNGKTILTLNSGLKDYQIAVSNELD